MRSALNILVCLAIVLVSTVPLDATLSDSPWQSPTSWEFRPSNNYNNIPNTRILRPNNYNVHPNRKEDIQSNQLRNSGQLSELNNNREQSSDWIPITHNPRQQNYAGRYEQNVLQRQQRYSRPNSYNTINVEEQLVNGRAAQRYPNYLVLRKIGNQVDPQALRSIKGKFLIRPVQIPPQNRLYRQGGGHYSRPLPNPFINREKVPNFGKEFKPNNPNSIYLDQIVGDIQRGNRGYPGPQTSHPFDAQTLGHYKRPNELPIVEGRILRINTPQAKPVVETAQTNVDFNQLVLRAVNPNNFLKSDQFPGIQGNVLGDNSQKSSSGYAVKEIVNESQPQMNEERLRVINSEHLIESNELACAQRVNLAVSGQPEIPSRSSVQEINEPNIEVTSSRILNSENSRSRELEVLRGSHLCNNIEQNDQQAIYSGQQVDSSTNNGRYLVSVALADSKLIFSPEQLPTVPGQNIRNSEISDTNQDDNELNVLDFHRQVASNAIDKSNQPYIVRPADLNPLIKNILFSTARKNETQTQNITSDGSSDIVVILNNNIPLPQLEVAEPFGLEPLERHYDLTRWNEVNEALNINSFQQQYNIVEQLV